MNTMTVKVNGDYQEFDFAGPARDLIDSASFTAGQGSLTTFPAEPSQTGFDYTIVPGHLGEVWLGTSPHEFFTLTAAQLTLDNGVDLRVQGIRQRLCAVHRGGTAVSEAEFRFVRTGGCADARRCIRRRGQRTPISVMFQLGEQATQLFGAYMPAMVPEVPEFDDGETRLQWKFRTAGRRERRRTNYMSPSDKYESTVWFDSETRAGVRLGIVRVCFGRRIELARRIREIGRQGGISGGFE